MEEKTNRFTSVIKSLLLKDPRTTMTSLLFFIGFYLFLWFYIDTRLIFHGGGEIRYFPVFYKGWYFFKESLFYPGGFVEYLSAFLAQFLYYSWTGALVITLQAWLLYTFTNCFLKAVNGQTVRGLSYVPPILLLILYSQYTFYFTTIMTLTVALGFVCLTIKLNSQKAIQNLIIYLMSSVLLYALVGGSFVVYALLCVMAELLTQRRWQTVLTGILSIPFIPYVEGVLLYRISQADAFFRLTPLFWKFQVYKSIGKNTVYILYLFFILLALTIILYQLLISRVLSQKFLNKLSKLLAIRNVTLKWILSTCLLFLLSAAAVYLTYDGKRKALFEVDYYGYHRMWSRVLAAAKANPDHHLVLAAVGRASYHLNRLGSSPMTLRQNPGTLLLIGLTESDILHWFQFDLYLDLGYVNKAEHNLVESLALYGEQPQLLTRLVLINLIKGNIGTAKIYLGTLKKRLFYSKWANRILREIESDPTLASNKQIQSFRNLMLDKEHYIDYPSVDILLLELLKRNRTNKMAFEYLMTCYILIRDLDNFAKNVYRFKDFNYPHLPDLFEEAVVLAIQNPNLKKYITDKNISIRSRSINRFKRFIKVFNLYKGNMRKAYQEFPDQFRNSYYFYYTF